MPEFYRITKFNPIKRETEGDYFHLSEWTAISDIGKPEYNNISYEEYERVETAYVNAVYSILKEKKIDSLLVDSLGFCSSKEDFQEFAKDGRLQNLKVDFETEIAILRNGLELDLNKLNKYLRLLLRETIHMLLVNNEIEIAFYWDFFMFVECEELNISTIRQIEESGLFVEKDKERPFFSYIDENGNEIE
jgi:hypothetical protein